MPDMIFVASSNVEAVGYDPASQELHVRFLGTGQTYVYYEVPEWVFEELKNAASIGSYLNRQVKGRFQHAKL